MTENSLTELKLKNFQSLAEVTVPIAPGFTAIVGPSNLGKSALLRAIKALAKNAAAPGLVRQGEKTFEATVSFSDGSIERLTKGSKVSEFVLQNTDGEALTFAKAGANAVPDEIEQLWHLPDFCLTTQHDKPFLLDESPSEVARTLGELTNASLLMEAVREANRLRTEALNEAKTRQREADECKAQILTHKGLKDRTAAIAQARDAHAGAVEAAERLDALRNLFAYRKTLSEAQARSEAIVAKSAKVTDLVIKAEQATVKYAKLSRLIIDAERITNQLAKAQEVITNTAIKRAEIETQIHNVLSEAGICPLCSQAVV